MKSRGDERASQGAWHLHHVSISTTVTVEERRTFACAAGAAPPAADDGADDRWICARLRELYASGSFWHVSAKLAADRIEQLVAERDCALAAVEVKLGRHPASLAGYLAAPFDEDGCVADAAALLPFAPPAPPLLEAPRDRANEPPSPAPAAETPVVAATVAVEPAPVVVPEPSPLVPAAVQTAFAPQSNEAPWVSDEEVEAVARILCAQNGVDADEPVTYREHKGVRVRSEKGDGEDGRFGAMPVWKWRFERPAREALEAAAGVRARLRVAAHGRCAAAGDEHLVAAASGGR